MQQCKKRLTFGAIVALLLAYHLPAAANDSPKRLFLQQVSESGAIVKWRGDADHVCYARSKRQLRWVNWLFKIVYKSRAHYRFPCVAATVTEGDHKEALLSRLRPDRRYYYSVGDHIRGDQRFRTAPRPGKRPRDGNTHIWIVGDSGTATELDRAGELDHPGEAEAVRDGFLSYNRASGNEPVDLFLMLGDNAYLEGTDSQYQGAVFDVYSKLLKGTAVWPTIGNHEMGTGVIDFCLFVALPACANGPAPGPLGGVSASADPATYDGNGDLAPDGTGMPYLDIFTLPTNGEAGGLPSGTEQYYSLDYGNVHVVSLDSQLTARDSDQRAAMLQWLTDDLASNTLDWTVVIFHHPPYSKGANHDSDDTENNPIDRPQWDMRNEFVPIFDAYGVDVVYSGHSHSYERSYYLHNHTGTSDTYSNAGFAELVDGDSNAPASGQKGETYAQLSPTSGGVDDRVVYTVAGNGGKADEDSGSLTTPEEWLRHPAHYLQPADPEGRNGLAVKGSVVIDASKRKLTARFVDVNGDVLDYFTITR